MKNVLALGQALSKSEMKLIHGGTNSCCSYVKSGCGTCGGYHIQCGISKAQAQKNALQLATSEVGSGNWCCDNCPSWLPK